MAALCGLLPVMDAAAAPPAPALAATDLYAATVHGCRAVDLGTWRHPTREVLEAARIPVQQVELCDEARFPVFTVAMPFDVNGPNDRFFNRLFVDLADANGFWSYALVDTAGRIVITVRVDKAGRTVMPSYEDYSG